MRDFLKYLRELSVVVIGVAVTLAATSWIGSIGERQDLRLYLDAVKLELEDNLKQLERAEAYMEQSYRLGDYLQSDKPENLSIDSLAQFQYVVGSYYFFSYKTAAFDMFKVSGAMRLIKDKELLLNIWNSYSELENHKVDQELYVKTKMNIQESIFLHEDMEQPKDIFVNPKYRPMLTFYKGWKLTELEGCIAQVRKTIGRLDGVK